MSTTTDARPLIRRKALATRFGVSERTIDLWRRDARLGFPKAVIINQSAFFYQDEIETWLQSRQVLPAPRSKAESCA